MEKGMLCARPVALLGVVAVALVAARAGVAADVGAPVKRWSFKYNVEGWRSRDSRIAWTHQHAKDDNWSLRIDVGFPEPAAVTCPVGFDVDRVGEILYHVYVPRGAPANVKTLLFLKDKDGLWFQHFLATALRPGQWNAVTIDVSASSPRLRPSGHHRVWSSVSAHGMNLLGIKFFCDTPFDGAVFLDRVIAYPPRESRQAPLRVLALRENALAVPRYGKFEITFDINRRVSNPFNPDHIKIDATFVCPGGKAVTIPAFFYQDYERALVHDRERLTPVGPGVWKARFAPVTVGEHQYYLTLTHSPDPQGRGKPEQLHTGKRSFRCVPSTSRGFVRISKKDPSYFEFDNGEWYYPIGHNVHTPSDDTPRAVAMQRRIKADILPDHGTFSYDRLFAKMADSGENIAEVWMCAWWLELEWIADWKHFHGLNRYNMLSAWRLDYLVDLAERRDLYLHLVFDNHGQCSTWCDPEWEDNPYNKVNGGFLTSPEEFFRDPIAKENYKKKLRYIVARWAYATRIAGFELWSEIDLVGDSYGFHSSAVAAAPKVQWHKEMSEHLDHIDPWDHIVTTHFSTTYSRIRSSISALPGIDYLTCDAYRGSGSIIKLILATAGAFAAHGKPGFITEYGGSPFAATVPQLRADLHAGLWSTYMTHTAGTPLLWWFQFIDSDDLYWNFKAFAAYHKGEDRRGKGLVRGTVAFPQGHPDLSALCLQNPRMAYLWVYSASAMESKPARAPVFENITVRLSAMASGDYTVEVWDCYRAGRIASFKRTASQGQLTIPLPKFRTDVALKVKPAPRPTPAPR